MVGFLYFAAILFISGQFGVIKGKTSNIPRSSRNSMTLTDHPTELTSEKSRSKGIVQVSSPSPEKALKTVVDTTHITTVRASVNISGAAKNSSENKFTTEPMLKGNKTATKNDTDNDIILNNNDTKSTTKEIPHVKPSVDISGAARNSSEKGFTTEPMLKGNKAATKKKLIWDCPEMEYEDSSAKSVISTKQWILSMLLFSYFFAHNF